MTTTTQRCSRQSNSSKNKAPHSADRLFAFDPKRRAIVLLSGDKRGDWTGWYERNIPLADDLYDDHLRNVDNEN